MPKNHDFSQKIEKISKILAPAAPKFGIYPIISAQKLGFFPKSHPLGQSPPLLHPWYWSLAFIQMIFDGTNLSHCCFIALNQKFCNQTPSEPNILQLNPFPLSISAESKDLPAEWQRKLWFRVKYWRVQNDYDTWLQVIDQGCNRGGDLGS